MKVSLLKDIVTLMDKHQLFLRPANPDQVSEYADRMKVGVTFPPIIVGKFPLTEKYGEQAVVDGIHRIMGADLAGIESIPIQHVNYKNVTEMLADMYTRNMAHGLPVTEGQRNARIQLLCAQGMTLEAVGKLFQLGKSSIDRIKKGSQGEGKSGRKPGGAVKSASHGSQNPRTASSIHKMVEKLNSEFTRKRQVSAYVNYLSPVDEDSEESAIDEEKLEEVITLIAGLQAIVKDVKTTR